MMFNSRPVLWLAIVAGVAAAVGSRGYALEDSASRKAREFLQNSDAVKPADLNRILNALPVQPGKPEWAEAAWLYAECCMREGSEAYLERAHQAFERLSHDAPPPWNYRGTLGLLRERASKGEDLNNLAGELDKLITRIDKEKEEAAVDAAYQLGRWYQALHQPEPARKSFDYALKLYRYLRDYLKEDFYAGLLTEKQLQDAVHSGRPKSPAPKQSDEPRRTFEEARRRQQAKQFKSAIELYEKIVTDWPGDSLAHEAGFRKAECLFGFGDFGQAKAELQAFLLSAPLGPWRGSAHFLMGEILLLQDFYPSPALMHYTAVLRPSEFKPWWPVDGKPPAPALQAPTAGFIEPEAAPHETWSKVYPDAHIRLGILAYYYGKHDQAVQNLERSASLRPDPDFGPEAGMGVLAEMARGKKDPLPRTYLAQGDERSRFVLFYASALKQGWDGKGCLPLFTRVWENEFKGATQEQRAYARFGMGEAYFHMELEGRLQALELYAEFLKPPLSKSAIAPRAILALASLHSASARTDLAVTYLERIIQQYPSSEWRISALYQRAFVAYIQESPDAALAWYARFIQDYPSHEWVPNARKFMEILGLKKQEQAASKGSK